MEDISKALAFEVKKEIAERYFGFRKLIEDNTRVYLTKIEATALKLENNVGFDLTRIYSLLKEDSFVYDFRQLTDLEGDFFFDSYINNSPTIRKRLFSSKKSRGLTSKMRYKNLFYDTYQDLYRHILDYHKVLDELTEEHDVICEQVKLFYRKNDISTIMQFFRNIDGQNSLNLSSQNCEIMDWQDFENKLKILPPLPAKEQLPQIPRIPKLPIIKSELNRLLNQSYSRQDDSTKNIFSHTP